VKSNPLGGGNTYFNLCDDCIVILGFIVKLLHIKPVFRSWNQ